MMSHEFSRRSALRLGALGAVGGAMAVGTGQVTAAATTIRSGAKTHGTGQADAAADHIVASVRRPHFPPRYFPVTEFGAKGDGAALDTKAFAAAIAACNRAGGGHVVVPSGGTFLTGAIHLRSH